MVANEAMNAVDERTSSSHVRSGEFAAWLADGPLAEAVFGAGLPCEAQAHLEAAARSYQRNDVAEWHLRAAQALAPDHAAVLIGRYRYYFYKNRLRDALEVARACLGKGARDNGFAADWREVRRADADFDSYDAVLPRFYLFTLKGYAYLQLRLGDIAEGEAAVAKLLELDPRDRLGGRVLRGVIERMGAADDD